MGEPITLYNPDGVTMTVYSLGQAQRLIDGGYWKLTPPDEVEAAGAAEEPEPATEPAATEVEAPAKKAPATRRKGKL